eukprot:gene5754-5994_t
MAAGSSLRDRTSDFHALAQRVQKQHAPADAANGSISRTHQATKQSVQQQSEFARKAADIGLSIHKASLKLQKLAQLAKRTSMFDDPALEIDELTGIIKQDIQGLNLAIADLQRISRAKADENKQQQDHSHTVVDNLRSRLKDATQEFKEVLTLRGGAGGQLMQQQFAPQESAYSSSRAEALHNVESTIVELGSIFTQLAEMVAAQGEMAQRIDENVEETLGNVDNAKAQLMKYLNNISSNRWLMMKVFAVLLVFLVIFIAFVA